MAEKSFSDLEDGEIVEEPLPNRARQTESHFSTNISSGNAPSALPTSTTTSALNDTESFFDSVLPSSSPSLQNSSSNFSSCPQKEREINDVSTSPVNSGVQGGFWAKMQRITEEKQPKNAVPSPKEPTVSKSASPEIEEVPVCVSPDCSEDFVISLSQCLQGKDRCGPVEIPLEKVDSELEEHFEHLLTQYNDVRTQLKEAQKEQDAKSASPESSSNDVVIKIGRQESVEDEELVEMQLRLHALESTLKKTEEKKKEEAPSPAEKDFGEDAQNSKEASSPLENCTSEADQELEEGEIRLSLSELEQELESWVIEKEKEESLLHPDGGKKEVSGRKSSSGSRNNNQSAGKRKRVRNRNTRRNRQRSAPGKKGVDSLKLNDATGFYEVDWQTAVTEDSGVTSGSTRSDASMQKRRKRLHRWQQLQREKILSAKDPQVQLHEFYKMLTTTSFDVAQSNTTSDVDSMHQKEAIAHKSAGVKNRCSLEDGSDYDVCSMDMGSSRDVESPDSIPDVSLQPTISPAPLSEAYSPTDEPFNDASSMGEETFSAPTPAPSSSFLAPIKEENGSEKKKILKEKEPPENEEEETEALRAVLLASIKNKRPATKAEAQKAVARSDQRTPASGKRLVKVVVNHTKKETAEPSPAPSHPATPEPPQIQNKSGPRPAASLPERNQEVLQSSFERRQVLLSAAERERLALEALSRPNRTGSPFQPPTDLRVSKSGPNQQRMVYSTKYQLKNMSTGGVPSHGPLVIDVQSSDESDSDHPNFGPAPCGRQMGLQSPSKAKMGLLLDQFLKDAREKTDRAKEAKKEPAKKDAGEKPAIATSQQKSGGSEVSSEKVQLSSEMRGVLQERLKHCERDMSVHREQITEDLTRLRSLESVVKKHKSDLKTKETKNRKLMELLNANRASCATHRSSIRRMNAEIQTVQARLDGNMMLQRSYEQQWKEIQQLVSKNHPALEGMSFSEEKSVQNGRRTLESGQSQVEAKLKLHEELERRKKELEKLIKQQLSKIESGVGNRDSPKLRSSDQDSGSESVKMAEERKRKRVDDGARRERGVKKMMGDSGGNHQESVDEIFGVFRENKEGSAPIRTDSSPLLVFRAYRLSSSFRGVEKLSLTSNTFAHKMNPCLPLCHYALVGQCVDNQCKGQHEKDFSLSNAELVADLAAYCPETIGIESDNPSEAELCSEFALQGSVWYVLILVEKCEGFLAKFAADIAKGKTKMSDVLIYLHYLIRKKMKGKQGTVDIATERVCKLPLAGIRHLIINDSDVPVYTVMSNQEESCGVSTRYFKQEHA